MWCYRKVNCPLSTHINRSFCLQTSKDLRWYPSDNRRQRVSCLSLVKCRIVYFNFFVSPRHHSRHIWPSFLITATAQRRHEQKEIIERADKCPLSTVELNGKMCFGHSLLHKEAFEHRRECMWAWTRRSDTIGRNERQLKFHDWLQLRVSMERSLSTDVSIMIIKTIIYYIYGKLFFICKKNLIEYINSLLDSWNQIEDE